MKYLSIFGISALLFAANAQANQPFVLNYECDFGACTASGQIAKGDNLTLNDHGEFTATMEVECEDKEPASISDEDADLKKMNDNLVLRAVEGSNHARLTVKDFFEHHMDTQPTSNQTFDSILKVNGAARLEGSCTFSHDAPRPVK